jgi:hypothetical protein
MFLGFFCTDGHNESSKGSFFVWRSNAQRPLASHQLDAVKKTSCKLLDVSVLFNLKFGLSFIFKTVSFFLKVGFIMDIKKLLL